MFDGNLREGVERTFDPVGAWLNKRLRLKANHFTFFGICMSVGTLFFLAYGEFYIGLIFFVLTGLADLLDGPIAKSEGTSSVRGAFFDSLADRITDALILLGMAWYIIHRTDNADSLIFLPIAILTLTQIISYQRAKAESLGLNAKGGLMERAERFIVLGFAIVFNFWLIETLWVLLGLLALTAVQRFVKIMSESKPSKLNPPNPSIANSSKDKPSKSKPSKS